MNKKSIFKVICLLFFFTIATHKSFGQSYKFTTSGVSVLEKNNKGKWDKWSDLQLVNILVTLDTNKNRFVVYSEIIQLFEIVDYVPVQENDTDIVYSFACKDNNGLDCTISIITRKLQENRKQLYITYDDHIILYNIFNM